MRPPPPEELRIARGIMWGVLLSLIIWAILPIFLRWLL